MTLNSEFQPQVPGGQRGATGRKAGAWRCLRGAQGACWTWRDSRIRDQQRQGYQRSWSQHSRAGNHRLSYAGLWMPGGSLTPKVATVTVRPRPLCLGCPSAPGLGACIFRIQLPLSREPCAVQRCVSARWQLKDSISWPLGFASPSLMTFQH